MNRENIKKVRDHIAGLPSSQFGMRLWHTETECGTCCCIGGWTGAILLDDLDADRWDAAEALGLTDLASHRLFYPTAASCRRNPWDATPPQAVRVLDHLLKTGEVDWSIIDTLPEVSATPSDVVLIVGEG